MYPNKIEVRWFNLGVVEVPSFWLGYPLIGGSTLAHYLFGGVTPCLVGVPSLWWGYPQLCGGTLVFVEVALFLLKCPWFGWSILGLV